MSTELAGNEMGSSPVVDGLGLKNGPYVFMVDDGPDLICFRAGFGNFLTMSELYEIMD